MKIFKKLSKKEEKEENNSKETAKERLHLVLMQDRANVSADFLELMKQEIIEVIKKYIDVDESAIDVRLTNKENEDGTNGAPALYANIPIVNIKNEAKKVEVKEEKESQEGESTEQELVKEEENEISSISEEKDNKGEPHEVAIKNEEKAEEGEQQEQQEKKEELKTEN